MFRLGIFIFLSSLLFAQEANAQIFSEDFNSGTALAAWTLVDGDGRTPAPSVSRFIDAWILSQDSSLNDSCASSTSWYRPLGQADDWMISPAINLTSSNVLSWEAYAQDNRFPDGYEVRISTTTNDTAAFMSNPPLFSIPAENTTWTRRSVNLNAAGYANQTVFLAWRNNSDDEYILNVDNIKVEAISGSDASLLTALNIVDEFWQIPLAYAPSINFVSAIENVGADTLYDLKTICEVYRNGSLVHLDSSQTVSSLAPTDTVLNTFSNSFTPSNSGEYFVRYYPRFNGADVDSTNNFYITDTLSITDSTYARDNGILNSSIGIGPGIQGELGVRYGITMADTLTSIDVFIANVNGQMNNQALSVNIRNFSSAPTSLIASSDTISYQGPGASWVNIPFSGTGGSVPLPLGDFFIGVVEGDSNLTIGTTTSSFTPLVNFIRFPGGLSNGWNSLDAYNISTTLMIRANFGPTSILVGNDELNFTFREEELHLYPNPSADGIFYIRSNSMNIANTSLRVYNAAGKLIETASLSVSGGKAIIDLSSQYKGMYFLEMRGGEKLLIKKLIYR